MHKDREEYLGSTCRFGSVCDVESRNGSVGITVESPRKVTLRRAKKSQDSGKNFLLSYFMCIAVLPAYVCICLCGGPLELELQAGVGCHVGAEN